MGPPTTKKVTGQPLTCDTEQKSPKSMQDILNPNSKYWVTNESVKGYYNPSSGWGDSEEEEDMCTTQICACGQQHDLPSNERGDDVGVLVNGDLRPWATLDALDLEPVEGHGAMCKRKGRLRNTISGVSSSAKRFISSSSKSKLRKIPRVCLKTPISLACLPDDSVKRTGMSMIRGKSPGIPEVNLSWNSSHRSLRCSSFSPFGNALLLGNVSWATIQCTRLLRALAKCIARNCVAWYEG